MRVLGNDEAEVDDFLRLKTFGRHTDIQLQKKSSFTHLNILFPKQHS